MVDSMIDLGAVEVFADAGALHRMMAEVSAFGATPGGGVNRMAATPEEGRARDWLRGWFAAHGFRTLVDPIGNLVGVLDLAGDGAPLVLSGSHLDSQPFGGRFDGAYGVVAACQAALAIRAAGGRPTHNLGVVSWTNEEGARFQPSLVGSSVFAGLLGLQDALRIRDGDGVAIGDALAAIGYRGADSIPHPAAYVELHVECGPELEASGQPLGVMEGWWGALKLRLSFLGAQSHTGPTAMALRRDALRAAGVLIAAIGGLADEAKRDGPEVLYTSVGRLEVEPNSPNVIPGRATLFIELRSPRAEVLAGAETALMAQVAAAAASARVGWRIDSRLYRPSGRFDPGLVALAREIRPEAQRLTTVAAHDAIPLSTLCPAVVVATPSVGGMCHHEAEFTRPEDLEQGLRLLTAMLWRLCNQ
jgi:N-carbamoyl-L-amino-acid hydrolase